MRKQFTLEEHFAHPDWKVVTRDGRPARIICTDAKGRSPIVALIPTTDTNEEAAREYHPDGKWHFKDDDEDDLFLITPEPEFTKFEKKVAEIIFNRQNEDDWGMCLKLGKEYAKELLDLAREELEPEVLTRLEAAYKNQDDVVYMNGKRDGKAETLKDLPKWQKFKGLAIAIADDYVLVKFGKGYQLLRSGARIEGGTEFLQVSQLEKLPKEESK